MSMLVKDILFILPPGFEANGQREFCPECAELWGVLSWYPAIRESLDVRYVGILQPRTAITDLLGPGHWNAPSLVVMADQSLPDTLEAKTRSGHVYFDSARLIARYFAYLHGTPQPRGGV